MRSHDDVYALEPYSLSLVDELFRLLDRIEPLNDNNYKMVNAEDRELLTAKELWLHYFNRYLFEHGTISKKDYMKMTERITVHITSQRREKDGNRKRNISNAKKP